MGPGSLWAPSNVALHLRAGTLALLGVAMLATACDDPRRIPVTDAGGGMRPFNELSGVALGMTTAELRRARPLAQPASGSGLQELLGDRRIGYVISGTPEHAPPGEGRRLQEVSAEQRSTSDSETVLLWRETAAAVTTRIGQPSRCLRYDNGAVVGDEAQWRTGELDFHLAVYRSAPATSQGSPSPGTNVVIASVRRREERPWWYRSFFSTGSSRSPRREVACSRGHSPFG